MNYKSILFQFLAGLFLLFGLKQFFIFVDLDLLELIVSLGKENFTYYAEKTDKFGIATTLKHMATAKFILGFVAIIINYVVLFYHAFKSKQNWNISLVITIVLVIIHYFKWIEPFPIDAFQQQLVLAYLLPAFISIILSLVAYRMAFTTKRI